jgi:hypothetical protein
LPSHILSLQILSYCTMLPSLPPGDTSAKSQDSIMPYFLPHISHLGTSATPATDCVLWWFMRTPHTASTSLPAIPLSFTNL